MRHAGAFSSSLLRRTEGRDPCSSSRARQPARHPARFWDAPNDHPFLGRKKTKELVSEPSPILPAQPEDIVELDEMWGFIWSKLCAVWLWFAVCRRTRQIVGWIVGKRRESDCKAFRETLEPSYRECETRSDKLQHYAKVFGEKHVSGGKEGTTRVEQFNNTVRQRMGMLVRRTLSFSRSLHNFVLFLLFFITKHNIASSHG